MIAFYHPNWQHYIRAIVDSAQKLNNEPSFILWAVDYGVPLHTKNAAYINQIPIQFKKYNENVFEASIDVLPAKKAANFLTGKTDLIKGHQWIELAVQLFQKCISDSAELKFVPTKVLNFDTKKIYFGDILLKNHNGSTFSLRKILLDEEFAVEETNFAQGKFQWFFQRFRSFKIEFFLLYFQNTSRQILVSLSAGMTTYATEASQNTLFPHFLRNMNPALRNPTLIHIPWKKL